MDHFNYRNGQLYAEDVSVAEIAESVGTPFMFTPRPLWYDTFSFLMMLLKVWITVYATQ